MKTATDVDYQQEQVCDMLDSLQHTPEELQALEDLVYHIHTGKDTDEYEPFNQDIMIGGFDKDLRDEEYFRMLDRDEMIDAFAFEDENQMNFSLKTRGQHGLPLWIVYPKRRKPPFQFKLLSEETTTPPEHPPMVRYTFLRPAVCPKT